MKNALFLNEKGRMIRMSAEVVMASDGINRVFLNGSSLDTEIEQVWTLKEAMKLHQLLSELDLPKVR